MASLDGPLAARLLSELSPGDLRQVEEQLNRLHEIEPDERAAVLAEFRSAVGQRTALRDASPPPQEDRPEPSAGRDRSGEVSGVVANFSAESEAAADRPAHPATVPTRPAGPLETAAPATIAELLAAEHPQTVAVILSRLDETRAGDVFALFSPDLQSDALDRLASLDEADPEALGEVERQLVDRLIAHQREQDRMAAGASLALKMLAKTDPRRRAALLTRLSLPGAELIDGESQESPVDEPAASTAGASDRPPSLRRRLLAAVGRTASRQARGERLVEARSAAMEQPESADVPDVSELTRRLLALEPGALAAALAASGSRTAQLALAASGDPLLRRLATRLPRRQLSALRKQLASTGPTSLTELCRAQARVLALAEQLQQAPLAEPAAA